MQPSAVSYPITLQVDPAPDVARWRPFVHWFLAIPHYAVLYVLGAVAEVCAVISWVIILFTGSMPEGLANVQALYLRYSQRVGVYTFFLKEEYPPFSFDAVTADPGDDPRVRVEVTPALTDRNRVTVFFRLIMLIPQAIVLSLVGVGAALAAFIAAFAVLFTGEYPDGLRDFIIGFLRWMTRVSAYQYLLTDEYPPFSLD